MSSLNLSINRIQVIMVSAEVSPIPQFDALLTALELNYTSNGRKLLLNTAAGL
jgi:hypothetical protein